MAVLTFAFFTAFPVVQTLYGAAQGAVFYLVAAMAFAALFQSEAAGAMATMALLALNLRMEYLSVELRISPFWNPLAAEGADADQLLAMAFQKGIIYESAGGAGVKCE